MNVRQLAIVLLPVALLPAVAALSGCPGAQKINDKVAAAGPSLVGRFASEGCLAQPQADGTTGYMTLAYDIAPASWGLDISMFGDEACSTKLGTIHVDGPYKLTGISATVPGAFDAELGFAHRTITPHVDGFIALLQSYACGKAPYAVNEPQDVLAGGCKDLGFHPVAECAADFDVVKIDGVGVSFGKRAADNNLCTPDKRPTELQAPFKRVP